MTTSLLPVAAAGRREAPTASAAWSAASESIARRALNLLVAMTGILLTLPLLVTIAVAIRLTSSGPVIFIQRRIGLDRRRPTRRRIGREDDQGGRPFRMFKFRTMQARPDGADPQVWARPDDARVTPVGRVLRSLRLDELPQLFNVLIGDMNVVGPRPEQPAIFARLRRRISTYPVRQRARPGITGLAQVTLTYDRDVDDVRRKVALDLHYLERQSVGEDLRIMARTLPVMLGRRAGW